MEGDRLITHYSPIPNYLSWKFALGGNPQDRNFRNSQFLQIPKLRTPPTFCGIKVNGFFMFFICSCFGI